MAALMVYLIADNNIITNIIVSDEAFAAEIGALPFYDGAEIGKAYEPPVDIEQLRLDKLKGLDGMCSGAIYAGLDIGTLHYNFTEKTQVNLETIARLINEGQTAFLYRADNETEQRNYTASEMKVIITAKSEWITVNTNYYEQLKKWISAESDEIVIKGIHYGSLLPSAYMQELVDKLSSVGIDVTKYAAMFI